MNTTTKCQHAAVFISLAVLLAILACVAFLAPVGSYHGHPNNYVEPVTQVVTNPTGFYDFWDATTSKYDRRHTTRSHTTRHRKDSTRHGSHHSTERPGEFEFGPEGEREREMEEFPAAAAGGGAVGAAAVGGAAFAAGYGDHDYDDLEDRRVGHGRDRDEDGEHGRDHDREGHTHTTSRSRSRHTTRHPGDQQATRTTNHGRRSRSTTESSRHRDHEGHERDSDDHDHEHAHAEAPTAALHASLPPAGPAGGPRRKRASDNDSEEHKSHKHKDDDHDEHKDHKHKDDDKDEHKKHKHKDDDKDDQKDRDHGHVSIEKDDEHPKGPQMMMHGRVKNLTPGEVYALSMHQFADMQNGCEHLGPAFNEGSYALPSRRKRSVFASSKEQKLERNKRAEEEVDVEGKAPENEEVPVEEKPHGKQHKPNGALMGFLKANEEGEGEFQFPIPKRHQEACATCGHAMGRGVSLQKVKGMPKLKQKVHEEIAKLQDYLAKFQNNRRKRALKPSSSLSSTSDRLTLGDYYHHRMNPVTPEEMAADSQLYREIGLNELNQLAYNNTLNGTAMAGYMEPPVACGVFARMNNAW
ncbi:sarcoplasmic reticulum histidine-rich calcium-binding protein-like [Paramacrobiotus metropolitanus]|uniref:sarcoplasmic reticulum histidine-rich calcium-binding protein-like n=1 Tax=Paramacrobiotus metropolitanus TaxID=2943436 RepID=UPI0024464BAF|nr:sarcoplasmic reticulum histidine-rich calcium-binding protein-like [Paramacrobiotus metropolitanus]